MKRQLTIVLATTLLSGCAFFNSFIDQSLDKAGQTAGDAVGNRFGTAIAGHLSRAWGPLDSELTQSYAMGLFYAVYYNGGYAWSGKAYQPGEYTQWEGADSDGTHSFEKAFLRREADKKEWWSVRSESVSKSGEKQEAILEALFSPPDQSGARQILRLRAKLPDQDQGEIPITEDNKSRWLLRPTANLSQESLKGATVGWEQVKVPAGTFKAQHIKYQSAGNAAEWWLSEAVPGGVVKYSFDKDEVLQLKKVGKNAKSLLKADKINP